VVGVDRRSRRPCAYAWGSTFARPRCGAARARVPRRALRFEGRAPTGRSRSQSSCLSSPAASRRFILPFSFFFFFFFLRAFPAAASAEAPPSPPSSSPPAAAPRDVLSRRSSSVAQTPAHTQTACTSRLARPRRPAAARAACAGAVVRHEVEVGEALAGRRPARTRRRVFWLVAVATGGARRPFEGAVVLRLGIFANLDHSRRISANLGHHIP